MGWIWRWLITRRELPLALVPEQIKSPLRSAGVSSLHTSTQSCLHSNLQTNCPLCSLTSQPRVQMNGSHAELVLTLPTLPEHCLFVPLKHSDGLRRPELLKKKKIKRGMRTEERRGEDGTETRDELSAKMLHNSPESSNRQNYHSGQKHIETDPKPWVHRIEITAPSPPPTPSAPAPKTSFLSLSGV